MAYRPISGTVPQYTIQASGTTASGYWLKFYEQGTTTSLPMGIDATPTSTLVKCTLNSLGQPISNSGDENTRFIPHLNAAYDAWIFPTEALADANNTAAGTQVADNVNLEAYDFRVVANYAAARALDSSTLTDGQTVTVSDEDTHGIFKVETGTVTDDDDTLLVFNDDSNRYLQRLYPGVNSIYPTAYLQTVSDILAGNVDIYRFIPKSLHSAIRARTSTTDVSTYFQKAASEFATARGKIRVPHGKYILNAGLSSGICLYEGDGPGLTVLEFEVTAGVDLINFTASSDFGRLGGVKGIEIVAKTNNPGYGIKTPKDASQYTAYDTRYDFSDLVMRGDTLNGSAHGTTYNETCSDGWLYVGDATFCQIARIKMNGAFDISSDPSGQVADRGIILDAASALLSARIRDIELYSFHTHIEPKDRCFFTIKEFDLVSGYRGIYQNAVTPYSESKIGFGNINVQETGILMDSVSAREIAGVTIRRHEDGWASATNDWTAMSLTDCSRLMISRILAQPANPAGGGSWSGTARAMKMLRSDGTISGINSGLNIDEVFEIDNCAGVDIGDAQLGHASGNVVYLNLKNNARRIGAEKPKISASSATYTIVDDNTIDWSDMSMDDALGIERVGAKSTGETVTISSGSITVETSTVFVDTEASAATDDLETIAGDRVLIDNVVIELRALSSSRTVVVKDSIGNISTEGDFSLTHSDDWMRLIYNNGTFKEVSRSDNRA